jgi:hypothetical protein
MKNSRNDDGGPDRNVEDETKGATDADNARAGAGPYGGAREDIRPADPMAVPPPGPGHEIASVDRQSGVDVDGADGSAGSEYASKD